MNLYNTMFNVITIKMKILFPALFISVLFSAQEKPKKHSDPKTDTVRFPKLKPEKVEIPQQKDQQKSLYNMPVAEPKEGTEYSGLNKKTESKSFRMPNLMNPDKRNDTLKAK